MTAIMLTVALCLEFFCLGTILALNVVVRRDNRRRLRMWRMTENGQWVADRGSRR